MGASSTAVDAERLARLLDGTAGRTILFVGDSSLRNQFVQVRLHRAPVRVLPLTDPSVSQLARIGLEVPQSSALATAVAQGNHTGRFTSPYPLRSEKPDSSNGYWGGFPWLAATTARNTTLAYTKLWGCTALESTLRRVRTLLHRLFKRRPPEPASCALVWNFGLHLLHVYPGRPVATQSLRCALGYGALVSDSVGELRRALPGVRLIWRTTNAACERRFSRDWVAATHAYHCEGAACSAARTTRILKACRHRYNVSDAECRATFMDARNTRAQREESLQAIRLQEPVGVLDAFALTENRCDETADGRHYPRLISRINLELLGALAG